MPSLPQPPDLKPTIIQMQSADDDFQEADHQDKPKKKRRRSSASLVSQNEIEKRRREHKTAHSIIEKKRRIRMNREFEALKFIVPACRNNLNTSSSNGEGMYKLTILQSTVDYIKYLHSIVNLQSQEIAKYHPQWTQHEDLSFAQADVNTDVYRDLEQEYDFNELFENLPHQRHDHASSVKSPSCTTARRRGSISDLSKFQALPSPIITPELYPTESHTETIFNSDFRFPRNTDAHRSSSSSLSSSSLSSSSLSSSSRSQQTSPQMTSALDIISEATVHEEQSAKALLLMKGDAMVSSIRSLLN